MLFNFTEAQYFRLDTQKDDLINDLKICVILYIVSKLLVFVDWKTAMGEPNLNIRVQTTILEGTFWHTKGTVEIVSGVEAGLFTVPEKKVGRFLNYLFRTLRSLNRL